MILILADIKKIKLHFMNLNVLMVKFKSKAKLQIFTLAALQTNQFRNNEIIEVRSPL